jgi:predicted alpha/beta hydrolase family esterase
VDVELILVGHSLGASVLLKYLSEEKPQAPLIGLFLLAAPYWGAPDWQVDEFTLKDKFVAWLPKDLPIYFYHNRDDEIVPLEHLACYKAKVTPSHAAGI